MSVDDFEVVYVEPNDNNIDTKAKPDLDQDSGELHEQMR